MPDNYQRERSRSKAPGLSGLEEIVCHVLDGCTVCTRTGVVDIPPTQAIKLFAARSGYYGGAIYPLLEQKNGGYGWTDQPIVATRLPCSCPVGMTADSESKWAPVVLMREAIAEILGDPLIELLGSQIVVFTNNNISHCAVYQGKPYIFGSHIHDFFGTRFSGMKSAFEVVEQIALIQLGVET